MSTIGSRRKRKLLKPDGTAKKDGAERSPKRIKSLCMADRMVRDIKKVFTQGCGWHRTEDRPMGTFERKAVSV